MKYLYAFLFVALLNGCSSGDDSELNNNQPNDFPAAENVANEDIVIGAFVSDAHTTTGTVSLNSTETVLLFSNFKTDSGPLLLVYLSTDKNSTDFVNLGELKSVEGNFDYTIPSGTDLNKYKVVSIWCVDFSVSFGHAYIK